MVGGSGVHLRVRGVTLVARSPRVVAALMSNETALRLQIDSGTKNRRGYGMEGGVDNNLLV